MTLSRADRAQLSQEKFLFYLVSLNFTILGLSIQTESLGSSSVSDVLELSAWLLLLVSGIIGLLRLEWLPTEDVNAALLENNAKKADDLREIQTKGHKTIMLVETGNTEEIQNLINALDESLKKDKPILEKMNRRNSLKYKIQKVTFILGISSLVVARSYNGFRELILAILEH